MKRAAFAALLCVLSACGCVPGADDAAPRGRPLRMAVTTSTQDTGLLDVLLPVFEAEQRVRVDVIAAGTGKALKLAEQGDVDLVLVHDRAAEERFLAGGHSLERVEFMYNYFELLGPPNDPARARGLTAAEGLLRVARLGQKFLSRGDESGTHQRELALWQAAGGRPDWAGYVESGQGMGATLLMAEQMSAYVLCDSGTYLSLRRKLSLVPLATHDESTKNTYAVMAVAPARHPEVNADAARRMVQFLSSRRGQELIDGFRVAGERLFHAVGLAADP